MRAFLRMPNIKQQKKRVRTSAEDRGENLRYRSTVKTITRRLEAAVEAGDKDQIAACAMTMRMKTGTKADERAASATSARMRFGTWKATVNALILPAAPK